MERNFMTIKKCMNYFNGIKKLLVLKQAAQNYLAIIS